MIQRNRRIAHPDDALRRLARTGRPALGQSTDPGRKPKPPSAMRQFNVAAIAVLAVCTAIALAPFVIAQHELSVSGLRSGSYLNAASVKKLAVVIAVTPSTAVERLDVRLDGETVSIVRNLRSAIWTPPADLADGEHRLVVRSGSSVLWRGPARREVSFVLDRARPDLKVRSEANVDGQALVLSGTTEPGVTLRVNGVAVPVKRSGDQRGSFRATFRHAPVGTVEIVAVDAAHNRSRRLVRTGIEKAKIRGVHVTPRGWQISSVRNPVFRMVESKQINTVMITLKDEAGGLAYRSTVPKAVEIGASQDLVDPRKMIDELHASGVRVVGRIVCFRDPLFVADAVRSGRLDRVVTDATGLPFVGTDGVFANPVDPEAQRYVLDIIAEAASMGFDDLILDEVRRPGGEPTSMVLAGLRPDLRGLDTELVSFLRRAGEELRGLNVGFGVTVLGASITDPKAYGQSVRMFAPLVDYLSPKFFPSRFAPGSFGIDSPAARPHALVAAAVKVVFRQIANTDAALLPWLQDFSEGRPNGPADVRAQIDAVDELGVGRWMLVDPKMSYNTGGIPFRAESVMRGGAPSSVSSSVPSSIAVAVPDDTVTP